MPIYEYKCRDCDHAFNLLRSIAERDGALVCPDCTSVDVARSLIVPFAYLRQNSPEPPTQPEMERNGGNNVARSTIVGNGLFIYDNLGGGIRLRGVDMRARNVVLRGNGGVSLDTSDSNCDIDGLIIE